MFLTVDSRASCGSPDYEVKHLKDSIVLITSLGVLQPDYDMQFRLRDSDSYIDFEAFSVADNSLRLVLSEAILFGSDYCLTVDNSEVWCGPLTLASTKPETAPTVMAAVLENGPVGTILTLELSKIGLLRVSGDNSSMTYLPQATEFTLPVSPRERDRCCGTVCIDEARPGELSLETATLPDLGATAKWMLRGTVVHEGSQSPGCNMNSRGLTTIFSFFLLIISLRGKNMCTTHKFFAIVVAASTTTGDGANAAPGIVPLTGSTLLTGVVTSVGMEQSPWQPESTQLVMVLEEEGSPTRRIWIPAWCDAESQCHFVMGVRVPDQGSHVAVVAQRTAQTGTSQYWKIGGGDAFWMVDDLGYVSDSRGASLCEHQEGSIGICVYTWPASADNVYLLSPSASSGPRLPTEYSGSEQTEDTDSPTASLDSTLEWHSSVLNARMANSSTPLTLVSLRNHLIESGHIHEDH